MQQAYLSGDVVITLHACIRGKAIVTVCPSVVVVIRGTKITKHTIYHENSFYKECHSNAPYGSAHIQKSSMVTSSMQRTSSQSSDHLSVIL